MQNKTLAIFGIGSYLLSVYSTGTKTEGSFTVPLYIILISGGLSALFTILATIRLWTINKLVSILFATSSAILIVVELIEFFYSLSYGASAILFMNIVKVISLLTFFWAVFLLWRRPSG